MVTDVNDETPAFDETSDDGDGGFCGAAVTEFHSDVIVTVRATDGDDGTTPNGQVDLSVVEGNRRGLFRMESDPGGSGVARIYPDKPLKVSFLNLAGISPGLTNRTELIS